MESWERISIAMVDVLGDKNTVQIGLRPLDSSIVNIVTMPVPDDLTTDESLFGRVWRQTVVTTGRCGTCIAIPGGVGEAARFLVGDRVTARSTESRWLIGLSLSL